MVVNGRMRHQMRLYIYSTTGRMVHSPENITGALKKDGNTAVEMTLH